MNFIRRKEGDEAGRGSGEGESRGEFGGKTQNSVKRINLWFKKKEGEGWGKKKGLGKLYFKC